MLKPSDIVQIPFPFSDLTQQKRRPVLSRSHALRGNAASTRRVERQTAARTE
jgi:hypothetical protein